MPSLSVATVDPVAIASDFRISAEVVVYCAYGDESRDDTMDRVYAVAGVFGHWDDWQDIEPPWKRRLKGKVFHASDCEFGHGEFEGMPEGECRMLYQGLTKLIVESKLCSFGVAINVSEFKKAFPDDSEHAPYYWGFGDVIEWASSIAHVAMPSGSVEITFDNNNAIEYGANELYDFLTCSTKVHQKLHLYDKVAFACRRTVGIQVADLIARETMKRLDNDLRPDWIPQRASFLALSRTNRFKFVVLGTEDFESRKLKLEQSGLLERASLLTYRRWLEDNGLKDCLSNRILHLREFPELRDDASHVPAS